MPPAIAPIPPEALKEILCLHGFEVIQDSPFNWILAEKGNATAVPLLLPKLGSVVAIDVMMQTMVDAKLSVGVYFALKEKVLGKNWTYPEVDIPN